MKYNIHFTTRCLTFQPTLTIPTLTRAGMHASTTERVGDISGEAPTNDVTDRNVASKLANLLKGLTFPASKEEIRNHLNRKSPSMGNRINDVFEAVQNNLEDGIRYNSVYEIERAAGLVKKLDTD
jgi:hypothetical protein